VREIQPVLGAPQMGALMRALITVLMLLGLAEADAAREQYEKMTLKFSKLTNPAEFKESVREKGRALIEVQKLYTKAMRGASSDEQVCALTSIGEAYVNMVRALESPPIPVGMPDDLKEPYRGELAFQANPLREKAREAFAAAIQKADEHGITTDCRKRAVASMPSMQPVEAPDGGVLKFAIPRSRPTSNEHLPVGDFPTGVGPAGP
jgi:hypothetical protein